VSCDWFVFAVTVLRKFVRAVTVREKLVNKVTVLVPMMARMALNDEDRFEP
jgi:hypothetical protein